MTEGKDKADRVATHVEERPMISGFCLHYKKRKL